MKLVKKIATANSLKKQLENGKSVGTKTLINIIGKQAVLKLNEEWLEAKNEEAPQKPDSIKRYELLLKKACLYTALMERYNSSFPRNSAKAAEYALKADSAYEAAFEYIREAASNDSSFLMWLDRGIFDDLSPDPAGIPRVIGSKSAYCNARYKSPYPRVFKRDLIIEALQKFIENSAPSLETFMDEISIPTLSKTLKMKNKSMNFSGFKF